MTKLQKYVLRDTLKALLPAFATLAAIMVVGFCMQLLHDGLDLVRLRGVLLPLLAYCAPMVLPSAFLTAVIINFGRLAADNELIAVRAAGIGLFRVVYPVLGTAAALSVLTAGFQFELVPRARAAISGYKYDALKQVLLDKVALSSKRQFGFRDTFVHYEDFAGGEMKNLLVLKVHPWTGRPKAIITAASSTLRPDPANADSILFEMKDIRVTELEPGGSAAGGEAYHMRGEEGQIRAPVTEDKEEVLTDEKYLPTAGLLQRMNDLKARLKGHERFRNPGRREDEERDEVKRLANEISSINETLEPKQADLKKAEEEPREHRQALEQSRQKSEQLSAELKDLRRQQAEVLQQISSRRSEQASPRDMDRLAELQNRQRKLAQQIESTEQNIEAGREDAAKAEQAMAAARQKAAELRPEVEALLATRTALRERMREHNRLARAAGNQDDLRDIRVRIHKRLVQAASVLAFALVGIPLGILAGGRSVVAAFGVSFAIVLLVFYPFLIAGQIAANTGALPVGPSMWAGNAFVFVIGALLTARVLSR
ncbi:MAG: LptF/LptG family permease [Planctomycetota bacterium]